MSRSRRVPFQCLQAKANQLDSPTEEAVIEKPNGRPFTIAVEGNIGSGKTTFLQHFEHRFGSDVTVLTEPVAKWQNINGHNLMQLMYEDPSRWSMTFQSYVLLTMLQEHCRRVTTPIKMMERSIYSARNCFVENLYRSGKMPSSEHSVYDAWYEFLRHNEKTRADVKLDLIVYLRTDPEVAFDRVKRRSRSEEVTIPLDYIRELHDLHENWLMKPAPGKENPAQDEEGSTPIYVIDANKDLKHFPDFLSNEETQVISYYKKSLTQLNSQKYIVPKM